MSWGARALPQVPIMRDESRPRMCAGDRPGRELDAAVALIMFQSKMFDLRETT